MISSVFPEPKAWSTASKLQQNLSSSGALNSKRKRKGIFGIMQKNKEQQNINEKINLVL